MIPDRAKHHIYTQLGNNYTYQGHNFREISKTY